jgi:DNA-binding response OmpR family regulator
MLQRKKLLLVEGDAIVLSALCQLLMRDDKFHLTTATNCSDAEFFFKDNHFDLIILNPELLKGRVQNYLDLISLAGVLAPIIFIGEVKDFPEVEDQNIGRLLVCIQRPFKIIMLLECIRRLLSKYDFSSEIIIPLGNIQFFPGSRFIMLENGQKVNLTEKETNILKYLCQSKDRIVSREVLLNEVWGHTASLSTHTLETYIYRLRQKISAKLNGKELIITKKGGYQLLI